MAILDILEYPDPRLRNIAKPVAEVDDRIRRIIDDMFDTMYDAPGIGLAATQVNVHERIITIDVSEDNSEPLVFINPDITVLDGDIESMQEGCLSVPGFYEEISRIEHCLVKALDRNGQSFEMECRGLLAVCIQHEVDHLDGKLMVDYLSPLKRKRIKDKLDKKHKLEARQGQR
ncbi:peptide deformylase [Bacterioplanes sanyensis]|uniref:Peptide deformylase n=1 Tax=Bacterioplanes sanyensis TaxID=1249553 RepID=A0A222FGW6_9GAMM|nr:peptide deformylase [Bacterioplanes sanyensis]ASP37990.1 peptide deformylase [Bacterioplanes sanyensis]